MDYSALEKEVDFDSDPMEECLRIFNESTAVKTEDKGRLARQVRAGKPGTSLTPVTRVPAPNGDGFLSVSLSTYS